jgi:magnesium chelatase subunit I
VATVFDGCAATADTRPVIAWFEQGGTLDLSDETGAEALLAAVGPIDGLADAMRAVSGPGRASDEVRAAVADFVLEGLCALKKISRTDGGQLYASPPPEPRGRPMPGERSLEQLMDEDDAPVKGKKKYYN